MPPAVTVNAWFIPLVVAALQCILGPIALSWMLRRERERKEEREDRIADAGIQNQIILALQKQIDSYIGQIQYLTELNGRLIQEHNDLINSPNLRRREDLAQIDEMERRITEVKGRRMETEASLGVLTDHIEQLSEIAQSVKDAPKIEKGLLIRDRLNEIINGKDENGVT